MAEIGTEVAIGAACQAISHAGTGETSTPPARLAERIAARLSGDITSPLASQIAAHVSSRIAKGSAVELSAARIEAPGRDWKGEVDPGWDTHGSPEGSPQLGR